MDNLAVTTLVMDPANADTIYAGTGEGFGNLDSLRGAGIFRTTDNVNWRQIAATNTPDFRRINRLAISSDGVVLLVATNAGLFRSIDANRTTWNKVLASPVADVKFHPTDANKAVAGSLRSGQVWRTVDGGGTWTVATHSGTWSGERKSAMRSPIRTQSTHRSILAKERSGGRGTAAELLQSGSLKTPTGCRPITLAIKAGTTT